MNVSGYTFYCNHSFIYLGMNIGLALYCPISQCYELELWGKTVCKSNVFFICDFILKKHTMLFKCLHINSINYIK